MRFRLPSLFLFYTLCIMMLLAPVPPVSADDSVEDTPHSDLEDLIQLQDVRGRLMQICEKAQPPGENGWPAFQKAIEKMQEILDRYPLPDHERRDDWDYGKPNFSRIVDPIEEDSDNVDLELRVLSEMREAGIFKLLTKAARAPRAVRPLPEDKTLLKGGWEQFTYLDAKRDLYYALLADMHLATQRSDMQRTLEDLELLLAMGRILSSQPSTLFHLVGRSYYFRPLEQIRFLVGEGQLSPRDCSSVLVLLQRHSIGSLVNLIRGEELEALDFINRCYTRDKDGNGKIDPVAMKEITGETLPKPPQAGDGAAGFADPLDIFADRKEMIAKLHEYYSPGLRAASRLHAHREATIIDFEKNADAFLDSLGMRYSFLPVILNTVEKDLIQWDKLKMFRSGTVTMLALEFFRSRQGHYPDSLSELLPGILKDLPLDPYSGKLLGYQRLTEDPWDREYTLYSVGRDCIDNHGSFRVKNALHATQYGKDKPGVDFVFNLPRRVYEAADGSWLDSQSVPESEQ